MAKVKKSLLGTAFIESRPKKTRQGSGQHTKYSATSSNNKKALSWSGTIGEKIQKKKTDPP